MKKARPKSKPYLKYSVYRLSPKKRLARALKILSMKR